MSSSKEKATASLKSAMKKTGSKGTISLPASSSSAPQSKGKVTISKSSKGKGKGKDEELEDEEDDAFEGESNASGFSGGEDDLDANDEFDLDEMDVDAEDKEGKDEEEEEDEDEADTEDEIDAMYDSKKKSKLNTTDISHDMAEKRKAATTEDIFGNTLAGLLDDDVTVSQPSRPAQAASVEEPSAKRQKPAKTLKPGANPILALSSRPLPPSSTAEALERKAKRALKAEEKERQDRARVKNVIEGWGATVDGAPGGQEWERGLRKVAQRGVIKLFNAILQASASHQTDAATLALDATNKRKKKEKDNVLGRGGKEDRLTKEGFLDLIKSGGK
ncbi:hypothetical protein QFC19_006206 [Naganishia cerealis]|uniref:Uncharacterized protein n=1 Tax=Naganishia cerealis TaxID=610337 RepID=A0ACC2VIG7_9TREE|nr:hypothetical protein QFC19_006206 [Naganishia cerealis]